MSRAEIFEALQADIVTMLEQGRAPWQQPWNTNNSNTLRMPHNPVSGTVYRGTNTITLLGTAMARGYDDPRWTTYRQAQEQGWQVRRGETASTIIYFGKRIVDADRGDGPQGDKDPGQRLALTFKVFKVFNGAQMDGIPPLELDAGRQPEWETVAAAERILTGSGARILHDQANQNFYRPSTDSIHLVARDGFPSALDYYEVALHELGHWTGHGSRLDRDLTGGFGSASYAREELRAQMASLFLSAELGLPFNPIRHASYNTSWLRVLKDEPRELVSAAGDANRIADYVLDLSRERSVEIEQARQSENPREIAIAVSQETMPDIDLALDRALAIGR